MFACWKPQSLTDGRAIPANLCVCEFVCASVKVIVLARVNAWEGGMVLKSMLASWGHIPQLI